MTASAERAAAAVAGADWELLGQPLHTAGGEIAIGTASWTDPTMTRAGVFYPRGSGSAEARLRYYATQFPVVEVDASYYSLPDPANSARWMERTPPEFRFHLKAHALMTGQPTETARLPATIRDAIGTAADRVYPRDVGMEVIDEIWRAFREAVEPLAEAGRLGGILLQYPRWFVAGAPAERALERAAERLRGAAGTVELRHGSWFANSQATRRTLDLLRQLELTHVMVDGPQGLEGSVPLVPAVTTPALAMLRLHGRRTATWEGGDHPTVERYRYLYSADELLPLLPVIERAAAEAVRTVVFFNNCYGSYGATNARELRRLLAGGAGNTLQAHNSEGA